MSPNDSHDHGVSDDRRVADGRAGSDDDGRTESDGRTEYGGESGAGDESGDAGDATSAPGGDQDAGSGPDVDPGAGAEPSAMDAATEEVDQRIVDLLSWILDTETRAKIYVNLLANPGSTSEEVAQGTGLYPSTVREALAELHDEEKVDREKRKSEGAGNNPYEYTAIKPSKLVGGVVDQVQRELNTIFTLDRVLDRVEDEPSEDGVEPVTITVDGESDGDESGTGTDVADSPLGDADATTAGDAFAPEEVEPAPGEDVAEADSDEDPSPSE